jgi:ATP:ADP antiporter, AAA family
MPSAHVADTTDKPRSVLLRALQVVAPVRPGEAATALLLLVNIFVLLTSNYVLKVVREPLILAGGGAELKAYATGGQALLLLLVVPAFGWLASRVNRIRLLTVMQLFFIGCLVAFYLLANANAPVGLAFYLWLGVYNMFVISNFWSFANDLYSQDQGKRLFPIIGVGGSLGAILGARAPEWLRHVFGIYELFLVVAAVLALSIVVYRLVDRRERIERDARNTVAITKAEAVQPVERDGGFRLVLSDRYLRVMAAMLMVMSLINTAGEYVVSRMATEQAAEVAAASVQAYVAEHPQATDQEQKAVSDQAEKAFIASFFSDFYSLVNLVAFLFQAFAVARVIQLLGVRRGLFVLPLVAISGWLVFLAFTSLATIRITKTAENSLDYSLQNTLRHALFLPTSRASKYKAKAAIDTFFIRTADAITGFLLVPVLVTGLGLGVIAFAVVNLVLVVLWLVLAVYTGRLHDRRTTERARRAAAGLRETVP